MGDVREIYESVINARRNACDDDSRFECALFLILYLKKLRENTQKLFLKAGRLGRAMWCESAEPSEPPTLRFL